MTAAGTTGLPSILVATGGSGGHLFPAFAVAEAIEHRWPGASIHFTTTARDLEQKIVADEGRRAETLPLLPTAMARRRPWKLLTSWRQSTRHATRLLEEFEPACVVGTGGWSMVPVVWEALRQRIPVVLLEQNAVPGRATRWFSARAAAVCSSFEQLRPPLKSARLVVTGNPVRRGIAELMTSSRSPRGPVLVLGGSQGARGINEGLEALARSFPELLRSRGVVHQTGGEGSTQSALRAYSAAGIPAVVQPFFGDLAKHYASAGLVISRAGATTLAEVACAALPAVLVPYPHAKDNHQAANAAVYEATRSAVVVRQQPDVAAFAGHLAEALRALEATDRWMEMSEAMARHARPDAAKLVVETIVEALGGRGP